MCGDGIQRNNGQQGDDVHGKLQDFVGLVSMPTDSKWWVRVFSLPAASNANSPPKAIPIKIECKQNDAPEWGVSPHGAIYQSRKELTQRSDLKNSVIVPGHNQLRSREGVPRGTISRGMKGICEEGKGEKKTPPTGIAFR